MELNRSNVGAAPKRAFTLAETMIVLAIMGVIASLTLPALLRRQTEQANRTRIRKAMKAYDTAIQKMVIENNIKTDGAFINWADDDCSNTASYFKISENGENGCTFKTSDGVWWNISDIKKPIVAVRSEKLTDEVARDENDNDAFYFITTFDPNARAFRTDDYAFETGDNKVALKKLYNFVKPEVGDANANVGDYCNCQGEGCCASNCQGEDVCVEKGWPCSSVTDTNFGNIGGTYYNNVVPSGDGCTAEKYFVDGRPFLILEGDDSVYISTWANPDETGYHYRTLLQLLADGSFVLLNPTPGNGQRINKITYDSHGVPTSFYSYDHGTCTASSCSWNPNPFDNLEEFYYGGYFSGGNNIFSSVNGDFSAGGSNNVTTLNVKRNFIDQFIKANKQ